jgi:hypothetical protein
MNWSSFNTDVIIADDDSWLHINSVDVHQKTDLVKARARMPQA